MAEAMYPLESLLIFNPVKKIWFHRAITNEVLLHSTLFSSAMRLSLTTSDPNLRNDVIVLMNFLFRHVHRKLASMDKLSDDTIAAVSSLAMSEVIAQFHVTITPVMLTEVAEQTWKPPEMEGPHGRS